MSCLKAVPAPTAFKSAAPTNNMMSATCHLRTSRLPERSWPTARSGSKQVRTCPAYASEIDLSPYCGGGVQNDGWRAKPPKAASRLPQTQQHQQLKNQPLLSGRAWLYSQRNGIGSRYIHGSGPNGNRTLELLRQSPACAPLP